MNADVKGIAVYCASSDHTRPEFVECARAIGRAVAQAGVPVINGAGKMGLMGAINDANIAAGGSQIGVIPQFMVERGWHHTGLTELVVTSTMHERKETMAKLSQGAIALPGGFGTFDELMEIITWRQLGLYEGNVVILNIDGYYDDLLRMVDRAIADGIVNPDHPAALYKVAATPREAVEMALADPEPVTLSPKF